MNSTHQIEPARNPPGFSDHPGSHYFLTIGIMATVSFPFSWARGYNCLASGNDVDCTYDIDRLRELGEGVLEGGADLLLRSLVPTLLGTLMAWLMALVIFAPVYFLAIYLSRRRGVQKNLAGVIFWIVAWMMAALYLPLATVGSLVFLPDHVSWRRDILIIVMSGAVGAFCGIVYCLLAFRRRIVASIR